LFEPQNFNFDLFAAECSVPLDFWKKYYAKMLLLPTFGFFIFVLLLIRIWYKQKKKVQAYGGQQQNSRDLFAAAVEANFQQSQKCSAFRTAFRLLMPMMFSAAVTLYTFLASNSVSPFNCVSQENNGRYINVMATNPIQECYTGEWMGHLPYVIFFSVLYGICFPLVVLNVFYRHRKNLDDPSFTSGYSALISLYRRMFFYWELVSMLKRASFVIMTQFLSARGDQYSTKFAASISTIGFFSGLEIYHAPYVSKNLNMLNST
jgi:hypothetical protein